MKCPFCSNILQRAKYKTAVVDVCPNCKGIWFDSGEFVDFVKKLSESEEISPQKTKLFERREADSAYKVKEKDKFCPRCNQKMRRFNYAYDSNVFLDKCLGCGGIWADGGEVQQVAGYLKGDPETAEVGRAIIESFTQPAPQLNNRWFSWFLFFPRVVIPLSDDTPRERLPVITFSIVVLCVLTFLGYLFFAHASFLEVFNFVEENPFAVDIIGSMVLSTGPISLIWSSVFFWLFGDNVEDRFSRLGYLVFCCCCGIFAVILYIIFNTDVPVLTIAISGAASGVIGAYFIFYPTANIRLFVIYKTWQVPAAVCLGLWFLFLLISPFLFRARPYTDTVCLAGIIGFISGAAVACFKKGVIEAGR